jgi:hypothetical protein
MKRFSSSVNVLTVFTVFFLLFSACMAEDATILHKLQKTDGVMGQPGQESTSVTYLSSDAIYEKSSSGTDFLIRFEGGSVLSINHKEKEYSEYTFEELNQALAAAGDGSDENKEAQAMMKKMMGNMAKESKLEKLGPAEDVAGYSTVKYQLTISPMVITIWAAPDLPMPDAYFDNMKLTAARNPMFDLSAMFDSFKEIEGVGMKTETVFSMMGMNMKSREEVVKVEKGTFPQVAVPAGYKKQSLF